MSPDLPVPPAAPKRFGFNTNLWWQTTDSNGNRQDLVPFEVDRSARAGAQVIRTTVDWATFASAPDKPLGNEAASPRGQVQNPGSLKQLDELYDRATAAGLQLDLIVNNAPKWASDYARCSRNILGRWPSGCGPVKNGWRLYPNAAHLQDLSNLVGALGGRYPGVIFEAWNEPNLDSAREAVGGAFIGQMQCAVWQAAKALPQPSTVLSAGFLPHDSESATRQYLRDFYSTGNGCFDKLSVHTYNGASSTFDAGSPLAGQMKLYRDARAEAGDTRPIWITEFGFSTTAGALTNRAVAESRQATLVRRQYNKLLSMADVETAIVHTLRDVQPPNFRSTSADNYGYGWLRKDGTPKPVYCNFTAAAGHPFC